ncbi:MAG: magnesium transporter CorA family protein [Gaiellaceae bacterium]
MTTALLFERDEVDEIDDWTGRVGRLRRSSILWIDLSSPSDDDVLELVDELELESVSAERIANGGDDPFFGDFGSHIHMTAFAPAEGVEPRRLERVECLVSERWVVTIHENAVPVLDDFRERAAGSGDTGQLDGLEFLADLLEWVLGAYLDAFEDIELALEDFDSKAMRSGVNGSEDQLGRLVELRQEIGRLRRALVSHRRTFLELTRPELDAISSSRSAERFAALRLRLEDVVQASRDSRESVFGSFDVLIARNEQRTNEIMKVLTLASVLLLPGALIAGVFGMNFNLAVFENNVFFWVVLGLMAVVATTTLAIARARRWI